MQGTATKKISLFAAAGERINLYLAIGLLPLFALTWIYWREPSGRAQFWLDLVQYAVFFNTFHVAFTIVNVIAIPEMRAFAAVRSRWGLRGQLLKWAGTFVALFVFAYVCSLDLQASGVWPKAFSPVLLGGVFNLISLPHALLQFKGLSALYNFKLKNGHDFTAAERERFARCERRERILFSLLFWVCLASVLVSLAEWRGLLKYAVALSVGSVILLLVNAARMPKVETSNKRAYLLRLLIWPFHLGSFFFAHFIIHSLHGVEYVCVTENVVRNSRARRKWTILPALAGAAVAYYALTQFKPEASAPVHLRAVWEGLFFSTTIFHYYLDGILFRQRDPLVRAHIAPLLRQSA